MLKMGRTKCHESAETRHNRNEPTQFLPYLSTCVNMEDIAEIIVEI
jgi:hypothetical protein